MQDDLDLIRKALFTGQISAVKVDAQRAFERVTRALEQLQSQLENVLDGHAEGAWMARALDAERELAKYKRAAPVREAWECGRCAWLAQPEGDTVPEHSPRCPQRIERAAAWDAGYAEGLRDNEPGTAPFAKNPFR
jgi:hypothetical protein